MKGLNGKLCLLVGSMYRRVRAKIRDSRGNVSESFNVGLQQGESLSPLLFSLLLNNLVFNFEKGLVMDIPYAGMGLL